MKEETEGMQNERPGSFTDPEVKEAYEELFSESGHEKVSHNILSVAIIILFYYFSGLFDDLFIGIGMFLIVVSVHEAGHYFFMRHRGFIFPGMFLFPFLIGVRDGAKGDNDAAGRAMAYLAGPPSRNYYRIGSVDHFKFCQRNLFRNGRGNVCFLQWV